MSSAIHQLVFPTELEEPFSYHDPRRPGFVSLLTKAPGIVKPRTQTFRLEALPMMLGTVNPDLDTYLTQNEFYKPNRRTVNVWRMPLAFADLDTYRVESLANLAPEHVVEYLLRFCDDRQLPEPSLIVFSGRGLQIKWLFTAPIPKRALPRWQAVQLELCRKFEPFGADLNARDASRVLRVVGTRNSKGGELTRVVHRARIPTMGGIKLDNGLIGHDFEEFQKTVLPFSRDELKHLTMRQDEDRQRWKSENAARDARKAQLAVIQGGKSPKKGANPNLRAFVPSQLAWDRLEDIRNLARLRGWSEGAPPGQRDLPIFLSACFLAQAVIVPRLDKEILELAGELAPTWTEEDARSCASAVYTRATAAAAGEWVEFKGRLVSPRYQWRNHTLLELLEITPAEEAQMLTIISRDEKRRRAAARKLEASRKAGALSRADWLAGVEQQRTSARLLRAQNLSFRAIAKTLAIPVATAHAYCKQ